MFARDDREAGNTIRVFREMASLSFGFLAGAKAVVDNKLVAAEYWFLGFVFIVKKDPLLALAMLAGGGVGVYYGNAVAQSNHSKRLNGP